MRRRSKISARYNVPKDTKFEYKNLAILQKFVNDRGKIVPRRLTGLNAKKQRELTTAVKRARFLALLPTGGVK